MKKLLICVFCAVCALFAADTNSAKNASSAKTAHANNAGYSEVKVTPMQAQGLGIKDVPIQNPAITRGVPFNALIDFDDKDSTTQSSTFDVVVVAIYMREGEQIKKGNEICEISSNELNNLYFEIENTQNKYRVAEEIAQKDKELFEAGVISQREYQASYLASKELFLKLTQLKNVFKLFGIDPDKPRGVYGFRIIANDTGILSVAPKNTGEKIPAFTPYVRISKNNNLLARIKIPLSISDYVLPGSKVYSEGGQYVGDISSVSVVVDKNNNSIMAIADLKKGVFRVGEVADVYIEGKQPENTFALPSEAVIKNGKDNLIFVKTAGGYMPRVVQVVEKRSKSFVISSKGFKGNEQIASGALVTLKGLVNNIGDSGAH
ncbi:MULTISPECIES: efflux RND transporter periplasmic adaptor subunit [unclassified Helicobacter]|uniref:efflux RND transporter periplasmic adaptor subunit n=1 Tax=unclassified Helicobacter TaxID=2593540 RepID=UPI000A4B634C|nr:MULTISPECIES: sodium:proton antiporter [unclassified Helicobacter]